ncbi:hypothetical protein CTA2_3533 [Colletotrichum tanaceti]|uniref:Uncharacterized protein n=1 Tax=Colletotrichum tanaceti TaxID=1306861 RepID=A0A4U6X7H6_9PEZI|nr:hypothetical protein CTA2_3533 [Colletotrichum tanaceti]TKW51451.1 hypothetical protein CTA1_13076 [Colletotrichum tanaceti]
MPRPRKNPTKPSSDTSSNKSASKEAMPKTKAPTKATASPAPEAIKKKAAIAPKKPEERIKLAPKRKIQASISPPAKRQKTSAAKPTTSDATASESDVFIPKTPKTKVKTAPKYLLSDTPSPVTSKAADKMVHEIPDGDSDQDPVPVAAYGSRTRRTKAEIARLKSQSAAASDDDSPDDSPHNADLAPKPLLKIVVGKKRWNKPTGGKETGKRSEANTAAAAAAAASHPAVDVPEGQMLVSKADYCVLMRRTVTVNKMVMSFTESACDLEDTNDDKQDPALAYLLAEARSLAYGVQSLTNAITQLPVTKEGEKNVPTGQAPGVETAATATAAPAEKEVMPAAVEEPEATLEDEIVVKQGASELDKDASVSK